VAIEHPDCLSWAARGMEMSLRSMGISHMPGIWASCWGEWGDQEGRQSWPLWEVRSHLRPTLLRTAVNDLCDLCLANYGSVVLTKHILITYCLN
jgi:hypothetical protein